MKKTLASILGGAVYAWSVLLPCFGAEGVIPNHTYPESDHWQIISPQLGTRHMNQPSVFNGYAIFAGNAEHEVWDISDPYAPVMKAEMLSNHAAGEAESHQVTYGRDAAGTYYMATISGRGIDLWNVTNTTRPVAVSELILPGINYGDVAGAIWGVSWQGNYLYCGATTNGLYVVDVSNPAAPALAATLPRAQMGGVMAGPVFALGDMLVAVTPKTSSGVATIDIRDPLKPKLMDSFDPPSDSYIGGFYGTRAYLITPFRSYDVTTDPYNIVQSSSVTLPASEYVSFADNHLYLGGLRGGTQGIYKYDITNPASPSLIGRVPGRDSRWDDQFSCPAGNLLLISDDQLVDDKYVGGVIAVQGGGPDTAGPTVKMVRPANGASGQKLTTQIAVSFSEWPEFTSVSPSSFIVRKPGGAAVTGKWGCTYTTLTFVPDAPLDPNSDYEIFLPSGGITDLVGNGIGTTFLSTFRTGVADGGFGGNDEVNPVPAVVRGTPSEFSVASADPKRAYTWDFGDGNSGTGPQASHTYAAAGRYPVKFQSAISPILQLEAEDAVMSGGVVTATNNPGYTGTGFADYPTAQGSNIKITWTVETAAPMNTDLKFRYAVAAAPARPLNLVVNGGAPVFLNFAPTGAWTTWVDLTVPDVPLVAGTNTIELLATAGSSGPNIDHLRLNHPDAGGDISTFSFVHIVYNPLTAQHPTTSQALARAGDFVWAVNPDADRVTAVHVTTLAKAHELPVGAGPKTIARAPDGSLWVTCREAWKIDIIDPATATVVDSIPLPYASQPVGLAFAPGGTSAYVTLQALGRLVKIDAATRAITASLDLGPDAGGLVPQVRGLAVSADGSSVYVTRMISPDAAAEVYRVDAAAMALAGTITLAKSGGTDGAQFSRGLPNYLTSITISPDGTRAWVPSKKDNIDRGGLRDGQALDHDVTVRAITSTIDLATHAEVPAERIDYDDSDRCHSCSFSELGDLVFVTLPGNDEVKIIDAYDGSEVNTLQTGHVPEAALLDAASRRLFVLNFLSRSLSTYDVAPVLAGGSGSTLLGETPLLAAEPLAPEVLRGKRIFYDAVSTRLNLAGYMSCASCHLDGGQDGRTYDFSAPMGEGFRNTIELRGRRGMGHGRVHWSGNFDEIHDFEGQIRLLGKGTGLMSDGTFNSGTRSEALGNPKGGLSSELDDLSAYVSSLDSFAPSPHRNPDGSLTAAAVAGNAHFEALACASCHGGNDFTDSTLGTLHDVGTLTPNSGQRLGGALGGIDTPTLRGVWNTAPYLHDGSAATLRDVLVTRNPADAHGAVSTLSASEVDELVAYLQQIDGSEPAAAPFSGVGSQTFASFIDIHGLGGAPLSGPADDFDGDGFDNHTEFLLGATDPSASSSAPVTWPTQTTLSNEDYFQISWLRRSGGTWAGNTYLWGTSEYTPQAGQDLNGWSAPLLIVPNPSGLPPAPPGYEWTTSRMITPMSQGPAAFFRLDLGEEP